jgi:hypothetical protein
MFRVACRAHKPVPASGRSEIAGMRGRCGCPSKLLKTPWPPVRSCASDTPATLAKRSMRRSRPIRLRQCANTRSYSLLSTADKTPLPIVQGRSNNAKVGSRTSKCGPLASGCARLPGLIDCSLLVSLIGLSNAKRTVDVRSVIAALGALIYFSFAPARAASLSDKTLTEIRKFALGKYLSSRMCWQKSRHIIDVPASVLAYC